MCCKAGLRGQIIITNYQISIRRDLAELLANRHLVTTWLRYRIAARYTQTVLGILWIVLLPLSSSLVLAFAFTQLLGGQFRGGVPFIVFLLMGQVIFRLFQTIVMQTSSIVRSQTRLMKQVYFPREILILLVLGEALVDFLFMLLVAVVVSMFFGIFPTIHCLLLPIPITLMLILGGGVALIVGWLSVLIKDLQQLLGVITQLLFYATVLYDPTISSERMAQFMILNPLSAITVAFRDITIYQRSPDFVQLIVPSLVAFGLLIIGYWTFKQHEDLLVDRQ